MKSTIKFFAGIAAFIVATTPALLASPRAAEASGGHYLVAADNLDGLHFGGYYRYSAKEVMAGGNDTLSQDAVAFTLGYDLLNWVSVYGILGTTDGQLDRYNNGEHGFSPMYGVGAWVNILDHDIISSLSCETRLRLTATAQFTASSPEINGKECDATDFYGALTLGIVNELTGNKNIWPDAIGIFFGPVWDSFDCDEYEPLGDEAGLAFGFDVYLSRRVALSASYETYGSEDDAVNFSINCRF